MLNSLRARLMLVSAGLSGAALAVFAGWTYARLYDAGLKEIDAQLRDLGERFLLQPMRANEWTELERSLGLFAGSDEAALMLIKGRDGSIVAQSANWPDDLATDIFEAPPDRPAPVGDGPEGRIDDRPPPRAPRPEDDGPPPRRGPPPEGFGPPRGDPLRPRPNGPPPRGPNVFGQVRNEATPGSGGGSTLAPETPAADRPPPHAEHEFDGPAGAHRSGPDGGRGGRGGEPYPPPLRTPKFSTANLKGGAWRIGEMGAPHATLVVGIRLDRFRGEMADLRTAFLSASGLALLGIVAGAWAVSNQALRPLRGLSEAIERVSVRGLNARVPEATGDADLRRLTQQFNAMMGRLEASFAQAARFSADAAHELKTPLAILQGHLEEAVRGEPAGSARQEGYSKLLEEVQRLKSIVGKLLLLSRADAGRLELSTTPVDLGGVVEEIVEDTRILAPALDVSAEIEPGVRVDADEGLLRQVLQNLCSNAVKYNLKGGKIRCRLRRKDAAAIFTVWNTGTPIPAVDRDRIFDRFYRVDTSRTRKVGGAGLGLALAREIARSHRGDLTLEPPRDGWVGFRLTLPLAP